MIELSLELRLDSFRVNSMGKSEEASSLTSVRALRLSCEKVTSVRQITENKPTADFEFLGSAAGKREAQGESEQEFDDKLFNYLKSHTTVDTSKVNIAYAAAGHAVAAKGAGSGEIGWMYITQKPAQGCLCLDLVLQQDEFDAAWQLLTQHKIRKVIANLVCFKLTAAVAGHSESLFVAGILSCALQFVPND